MAEIKIEKRKTVWPYLLGAIIIVALLLYFFVFRNNNENASALVPVNDTADYAVKDTSGSGMLSEVAAFSDFISNDANAMALDHSFTSEALHKLISAVEAKAGEMQYDVDADLQKVRSYADRITKNPYETSHADDIRRAADVLAGIMQNMQQANFPGLQQEAGTVKQAASAIDPSRLTLDQKTEVKNFFDQSAMLLKKMNV